MSRAGCGDPVAYADFLTQRCSVLVQKTARTSLGGTDRDPYTVVESGVACLYRPGANSVDPGNDRRGSSSSGRFYFLQDYGLTTKHQIQLGARIFNVIGTNDANSLGRTVAVDVEEVIE